MRRREAAGAKAATTGSARALPPCARSREEAASSAAPPGAVAAETPASATRSQGAPARRKAPADRRTRRGGHSRCASSDMPATERLAIGESSVEGKQRLGGRPVGAVDEESPIEPATEQGEPLAECRQAVVIFLAVLLGAPDDMTDPGLGIVELGATGEGKRLLDRVEDLDEMSPGTRAYDP